MTESRNQELSASKVVTTARRGRSWASSEGAGGGIMVFHVLIKLTHNLSMDVLLRLTCLDTNAKTLFLEKLSENTN